MRMDVTVAIVAVRNVFWWGSTKIMSEWLEEAPIDVVYDATGAVLGGVTALTVVFYCWEKMFRLWVWTVRGFVGWEGGVTGR